MPFNLAEAATGQFSNNLINQAATFLGENEAGIHKAINGIVPVVLGGLVDKAATKDGANTVAQLATGQHQAGMLNNADDFFGSGAQSLFNHGAGLTHAIFDDKVSVLSGSLSDFAGIKTTSAGSLLSIATVIVLAYVGKNTSTNNLDASGLSAMLNNQKDKISSALPQGLNLSGIFDNIPPTVADALQPAASDIGYPEQEADENTGTGLKFLIPLLLLVLLAAAAWYFMGVHGKAPAGK